MAITAERSLEIFKFQVSGKDSLSFYLCYCYLFWQLWFTRKHTEYFKTGDSGWNFLVRSSFNPCLFQFCWLRKTVRPNTSDRRTLRPLLQERPDSHRGLLLAGRHNSSPKTNVKPSDSISCYYKVRLQQKISQETPPEKPGSAPQEAVGEKAPPRVTPTLMCMWLNYRLNQRSQSWETHTCVFPGLVLTIINQVKSAHLHGQFIGQFTLSASHRACWHFLLFQLQGPTTETPSEPRKAQTWSILCSSCSGFAAVAAKTLMIHHPSSLAVPWIINGNNSSFMPRSSILRQRKQQTKGELCP